MDMLDKRMNDRGKNWRHVYKALTVFDYILHMGSEQVVLWGKDNIYLIKTLREFIYMDESGKDQGTNIRQKAKDITALLNDDERLRSERKNRNYMVDRLNGNESGTDRPLRPQKTGGMAPARSRRSSNDDMDPDMRQAIEESKRQAELDARKRRGGAADAGGDDDLARALKLSEEEEEARKRRLAQASEQDLFDDSNDQSFDVYNAQPQQQQVDFFGNPIMDNTLNYQNTGYLQNAYAQYQQPQHTGGYYPQQQQQNEFDDYGGGAHDFLTAQNTGMNAASQVRIERQQTGRNNPYAAQQVPQQQQMMPEPAQRLEPVKTGSNNPFAAFGNFNNNAQQRPFQPAAAPTLAEMQARQQPQQPAFASYTATMNQNRPVKDDGKHADLAALIGAGTGTDTFGNSGDMRVARHHTSSQAFMNSAGKSQLGGVASQQTGNAAGGNPFLNQQRTGNAMYQQQQQQMAGQPPTQGYIGTQQTGGFAYPGQQPQGAYGGYGYNQQRPPQQQQQQSNAYGGSLIDL
jgi:epsin